MVEEGLFHWFEHTGDSASPNFGAHTLVIADHNGAFAANAQTEVRFTQSGAVMREDGLDHWRSERRWQPSGVALHSWDYRTLRRRPAQARSMEDNASDASERMLRDNPGQYAWGTSEQAQRMADAWMQSIDAASKTFTGAGTVRTLAPATTFPEIDEGRCSWR